MRIFLPEDVCCGLLSESALFVKCAQTHDEFVVFFKKLLAHACIHTYLTVSPLSCVSCVPASCAYLVCFLSLFSVIISSFLSSCVCLIIYDYPV